MQALFEGITQALREGRPVALATVVQARGSTPREAGAKMVVFADGTILGTVGGGAMEAQVIAAAREALAAGESRLLHFTLREGADEGSEEPGICGGDADVFIDVMLPQPTLLIAGAGHIAVPLARLGDILGFRVVVVDDRADFATPERFPTAGQLRVGDIATELSKVDINNQTYVVIITRGHAYDEAALRAVVNSPAAYIGMIGSRRKVATVFSHLREAGVSEEALARVHAPIGLDIGAETPEEIAVSIAAEIILVRRGGSGRTMREARGVGHD